MEFDPQILRRLMDSSRRLDILDGKPPDTYLEDVLKLIAHMKSRRDNRNAEVRFDENADGRTLGEIVDEL